MQQYDVVFSYLNSGAVNNKAFVLQVIDPSFPNLGLTLAKEVWQQSVVDWHIDKIRARYIPKITFRTVTRDRDQTFRRMSDFDPVTMIQMRGRRRDKRHFHADNIVNNGDQANFVLSPELGEVVVIHVIPSIGH